MVLIKILVSGVCVRIHTCIISEDNLEESVLLCVDSRFQTWVVKPESKCLS